MHVFIISLLLFSNVLSCFSQKDDLEYNCYNNRRKLTWNDFLVNTSPQKNSLIAASVSTGLDFTWDYNINNAQQNFSYSVCAKFYPKASWVIKYKKDSILLAHQQLHFDITELYARKLRKAVSNYKLGRNIRKNLGIIYKNIEASRQKMQKEYDIETEHSKNKKQQHIWNKKIDSLLTQYQLYNR